MKIPRLFNEDRCDGLYALRDVCTAQFGFPDGSIDLLIATLILVLIGVASGFWLGYIIGKKKEAKEDKE